MDKLSFKNSQVFSQVPNSPNLLKTNLNPPSHDHRQMKYIITSKLDFKPPNLNNTNMTSSSHELPPLHHMITERTQHLPKPIKTKKPHKEVAGWNPLQRVVAAALDLVERGFVEELEKKESLPGTVNPDVQLAGNFFPVPESAVEHELEVEGKLPEGLEGVYVRNGANPMYRPLGGHHLFDGDGMLHAVRIKQGIASYANRFTRTHRFVEEERVGRPIFPKAIGELHGHSGIARLLLFYARAFFGIIDGNQGIGVANAGVVFFNGLLLAMSEDDLPYAVHITSSGDLQTLGKYDFNGQLNSSMIAHPKVDLETGELFALSYDVIKKPYVKYFKVNRDGEKGVEVSITGVNEPTMMHDFAITKSFVVIPDQQVIFKLQEMLRGGSPVSHNAEKTSRFGVLPRGAVDDHEMKWVDVPDCFCFHLWNAWEEGDEVVVIGSCMTPPDSIFNESKEALQSVLTEIRLNLKSLTSHRRVISPSLNLEAGQVNRKLLGKKSQFAYLAIAQPWPKVSGIAKVKLLANNHTSSPSNTHTTPLVNNHNYPPSTHLLAHTHTSPPSTLLHTSPIAHTHTSPPSTTLHTSPIAHTHTTPPSNLHTNITHTPLIDEKFTLSHPPITTHGTHQHNPPPHNKRNGASTSPNPIDDNVVASFIYPPNCFGGEPMFVPRSLDPSAPEDDGYVLTFMHNEETCESKLLILDASSHSLEILACIKIPSRVPYGFHGTFVTSQELVHQKSSLT